MKNVIALGHHLGSKKEPSPARQVVHGPERGGEVEREEGSGRGSGPSSTGTHRGPGSVLDVSAQVSYFRPVTSLGSSVLFPHFFLPH